MSDSSWKVVSITGNMIWKGADRGSRKMWFVELLFTEQALQRGNSDKFTGCEASNNDSQLKPEVRLKKYY